MIDLIVAARPNFVKIAPLIAELKARGTVAYRLVHTGQHYDLNMSEVFFRQFRIGEPDVNLAVGSRTHAEQIAHVLMAYDALIADRPPALTVVVGDVNAVPACALAAAGRLVPLAHLEAGLRSFDRTMPEEVNRLLADRLSTILWTPSPDAEANLLREGVAPSAIVPVGNIMIDSFSRMRPAFEERQAWRDFGCERGRYGLVTLHRPSNVDDPQVLKEICGALRRIAADLPLIFPIHPRTRRALQTFGLERWLDEPGFVQTEPLDYISFQSLLVGSRVAVTDSGGVQEETTFIGIPCVTVRANTERPITVEHGTNRLVSPDELHDTVAALVSQPSDAKPARIAMWDGRTAGRVADSIERFLRTGMP